MSYAIIIGTRPEIIKMFPVMKEMDRKQINYFIVHSGQHYSYALDGTFFDQLAIKRPKYNLEVGSSSQAEQTAKILVGVEKALAVERPEAVLIQGDTNTVLGGAISARKLNLKVGHIEAGLRSYDWKMPEEINRIVADHCSDYLFAPTEKSRGTLLNEGIPKDRICVTGNTIVDAVYASIELLKHQPNCLDQMNLVPDGYCLVTLHRQENVDQAVRFSSILKGLQALQRQFRLPIIFPVHPRSHKRIEEFKLSTQGLSLIEPLDYFSFLQLQMNAKLILTDSGGVQEEACILNVPCVTLRDNSERMETVEVGANMLAGSDPDRILECAQLMLDKPKGWLNPFGNGNAGETIVRWLLEHRQ